MHATYTINHAEKLVYIQYYYIMVGHWPFLTFPRFVHFARTKLLHNFSGEANDSLYSNVPTINKWMTNF